jgi:hypothetical protein
MQSKRLVGAKCLKRLAIKEAEPGEDECLEGMLHRVVSKVKSKINNVFVNR